MNARKNMKTKLKTTTFTIIFIAIGFSLVSLFFLFGCTKKIQFTNELKGTLTIVGSSSTQEVCDSLADAFMQKYKNVEVVKSGAGSAQAANAVLNGTAQIGDLSRELNPDENPENFECHKIATDGIAVCVNNKNTVNKLNLTQLKKIFTGKIKNWADVNGPNKPIVVIGRDEASGTKKSFEKLIDATDRCVSLIEQDSNGKIKEKIKNDENAIGYISFSSVDTSLKPLKIDTVTPCFENILNGTYKLCHPFIQIVKKNSHDELVNAWFNFVNSQQGREIIKNSKLLPIKMKK